MDLKTILDRRVNIASRLDEDELTRIGALVVDDFQVDKQSRAAWERRMATATKLALQVMERKDTPWENASNVKLPLITIACMQFAARTYPTLIQGTDIVKMRVIGDDPEGTKHRRAWRVSRHMSYQCLEQDEDWEEETDRSFIGLPLFGCVFKKKYFDPVQKHIITEMVPPTDLVVNYYAKSLETASRYTHMIELRENEIVERVRSKMYREIELGLPTMRLPRETQDEVEGKFPTPGDSDTPHLFLEQYRYLDLDKDGYQEPYIVTVHADTAQVVRIAPRFRAEDIRFEDKITEDAEHTGKIVSIRPRKHFTKYSFVPSPDGGFYELGFGLLLGPLNSAVDTLINQLIDAGTLQNNRPILAGRGARLKAGQYRVKMGQVIPVPTTGDDIRKSFMEWPSGEPSAVLFNLLTFLVEYARQLSTVTDMMVGKTPGQNTPATTTMAALEEGMRVFTAIHKRIYRAMTKEFRLQYELNREFLDYEEYFQVLDSGEEATVLREDYDGDPTDVRPSADPSVASESMRMMKAEMLASRAMQVPGYRTAQAELRYLQAMNVEAVDEIFPVDPKTGESAVPPPPNPEVEIEMQRLQAEAEKNAGKLNLEMAKLRLSATKAEAEIAKMEAESIALLAKAEAEEVGNQLEEYKLQLEGLKSRRETLLSILESMETARAAEQQQQQQAQSQQS